MAERILSDATVVGGGIIGLASAYYLRKSGLNVTVIERDINPKHASWAGAGILSPLRQEEQDERLYNACDQSLKLFPPLCEHIGEIGIDTQLIRSGMQVLFKSKSDPEIKHLTKHISHYKVSDSAKLQVLYPFLSKDITHSILIEDVYQIRNDLLLKGLRLLLNTMGVRFVNDNITSLEQLNGSMTSVKSKSAKYSSKYYIIATGPWINELVEYIKAEPVKGYMILARSESHFFKEVIKYNDFYFVPRTNGDILIGSTLIRNQFDEQTKLGPINHILTNILKFAPGASDWSFSQVWSGLRPSFTNRPPIIDFIPGVQNCIIAGGHYRNGITLAPLTGQIVASLIDQRKFDNNLLSIFNFGRGEQRGGKNDKKIGSRS